MQRILGAIAFICFSLSFLIHIGTFFGFNAGEAFPIIWCLQLFIFLLAFLIFRELAREQNLITAFPALPIWGWRLLIIFISYTAIVSFLVMFIFGAQVKGTPIRINGTHAIYQTNEGNRVFINSSLAAENLERVRLSGIPTLQSNEGGIKVFTEITEAEFYQYTILSLRMVTGAWMVFFLILTLYSWYSKPQKSP